MFVLFCWCEVVGERGWEVSSLLLSLGCGAAKLCQQEYPVMVTRQD